MEELVASLPLGLQCGSHQSRACPALVFSTVVGNGDVHVVEDIVRILLVELRLRKRHQNALASGLTLYLLYTSKPSYVTVPLVSNWFYSTTSLRATSKETKLTLMTQASFARPS